MDMLETQIREKRSNGPFRLRESYTQHKLLQVLGQGGHNPHAMIVYTTGVNFLWMREKPYIWSYSVSELFGVARTVGVVGELVAPCVKEVIRMCSRSLGRRQLDTYKGFYMAAFHLCKEEQQNEAIAPGLAIAVWKEALEPYKWSKTNAWCNFYKEQHGSEPVTYDVWMGVHDYVVADTNQQKFFFNFEPPGPLKEGDLKTMIATFEVKLLRMERVADV